MDAAKAAKYLKLAEYQAELFSKDPSTKVAAIVLCPESLQVLSTGYNGLPRKINELAERWQRPAKYNYVVHAEANAICNAAAHGVRLKGGIVVVTMFPCNDCAKLMIQSGINTVVCREPDLDDPVWGHKFAVSRELLQEAGINFIYI